MRHRLALLLFAGIASVALAQTPRVIRYNEPINGTIAFGSGTNFVRYELTVNPDVFGIRVTLADAPADLDLYLSNGGDFSFVSELSDYNEKAVVTRVTDPQLRTGRLTIEVMYQLQTLPHDYQGQERAGRRLIPFTLTVEPIRLVPGRSLRPGESVTGVLDPDQGMVAMHRVEAPAGTSSIRFDVVNTDADVDLFLFAGPGTADLFTADYRAETLRSTEQLVVSALSSPQFRPGIYDVIVIDQVSVAYEQPYTLVVSEGPGAPRTIRSTPSLPEPQSRRETALLATVELSNGDGGSGSGILISDRGHLLSNWHVVRGADDLPADDIVVAFSVDHTRPPVEMFRARVLEYSEERDLALLQITTDRYGGSLPRTLRFPFLEISDQTPVLGSRLVLFGYPRVGGTTSRASVTLTAGVVAGFQRTSWGFEIKTDAEINAGNSGGAAVDPLYRLVGVPSSVMGQDSGQIGYLVPASGIPAEWRRLFE
jgi:S1-C subfamily serine protease